MSPEAAPRDAVARHAAEELEESARLVMLRDGKPVRRLDEDQVEDLVRIFGASG